MTGRAGYGQFCPVAIAAEVLAERWTPLVVRELLLGSTRFNDLQRGLPRMSSALLARRLKDLELAGVVQRRTGAGGTPEYHPTEAGKELFPIIEGMGLWSQRWMRHDLAAQANLDPDLLMWDIRRNVRARHLADRRLVVLNRRGPTGRRYTVEFLLGGAPSRRQRWWLVFEPEDVDLCYKFPGFSVDLHVTASLDLLTRIWLGHVGLDQALREQSLVLDGSREDIAAFRSWFVLSHFAPAGALPPGAPAAP